MKTKFLMLVPLLASVAGCSEQTEAQPNDAAPTEIASPREGAQEEAKVSEPQETELKLRSPVGLD